MATSFKNQKRDPWDVSSKGPIHLQPPDPLNVDTGVYKEGYGAGLSSVYSFMDSKSPRHVDVRPLVGKSEQESLRSQLRPIKWTEDLGYESAAQFRKHNDPHDIKDEEVRDHAILMFERLTFQRVHYNCKGPPPHLMVEQSLLLGPKFTADWASAWKEGRFKWTECERMDPVVDKVIAAEFLSYNETYPPFFFIFWEEESDDYSYMFRDAPESDEETLEQLQMEIAAMSEEYISEEDLDAVPDNITYNPTSSNAFENAERSRPEWEVEFKNPQSDEIADHLTFLRGQARKRPSEIREIGTMTPQSMRLHRKIMFPMQKACRRIPGCVYGRDQSFIKEKVIEMGNRSNWFYMRDYAKSGMTIPHKVRNAILRGFYARRPRLAEKYIFAFDKQVIYFKNGSDSMEQRVPTVGNPLGMFVEGFTLLQYAVDRIITRTLGFSVDFSATNDDMIVGSKSEERMREYILHDFAFQTDLGMLVKATKSGLCHNRFFFCEEYWDYDHLMSKEVLGSLSLLGAKFAINIVHAKELVYSILLSIPYASAQVKKAIFEVQTCYEPEFSEQEHTWPYLFGGWVPHIRDGLDVSIEFRNGDSIADAAYWACREKNKRHKELEESPTLSYGRHKNITLLKKPDNPSDYISLIPLFGTKGALSDYYTLLSRKPKSLVRHYRSLWVARQRAFVRICNGKEERPSVTAGYLRRHPNSRIILGMEGLEVRDTFGRLSAPKLGFKMDSGDSWLSAMHLQGIINFPSFVKISKSEQMLHTMGLTKELEYKYINVPEAGCSSLILNSHFRGLEEFQERTGKAIVRVDSDDEPFDLSKQWIWSPNLPLQWIIRCKRYSRPYPDFEFSERTGPWWADFVKDKHSKLESWPIAAPETEVSFDVSTFEEVIIDYLANMLDGAAIQVRARLVPLAGVMPGSGSDYSMQESERIPAGMIQMGEGNLVPVDPTMTKSIWDDPDEDFEEPAWFYEQ